MLNVNRFIKLGTNCIVYRNLMHFSSRVVKIYLNLKWKQKMSLFNRMIITALTLPLLKKYNYI